MQKKYTTLINTLANAFQKFSFIKLLKVLPRSIKYGFSIKVGGLFFTQKNQLALPINRELFYHMCITPRWILDFLA